jgi:hypothetical protein
MEAKCDSLTMTDSSNSPAEYTPLHNKDAESLDGLDMIPMTRQNHRRRRSVTLLRMLSAFVLVGFIVLTFGLSFHAVELLGKIGHMVKEGNEAATAPVSHGQRSYKYPCGQTAAEALEKGCIFDIMSMAWQSPECYDPDLAEEFADLGPWIFYSSQDGRQILPYKQVSQTGQISWTTRRYFVQHCVYGWKAMHRAWQRGWRMDSNLASIEHTELCARVLQNTSVPLEEITTRIHVDFPSCN